MAFVITRGLQDVNVLAVRVPIFIVVTDLPPSSMAFVLGKQTSGIKTRSPRTGARNFEILEGRRPAEVCY